MSLFGGDSPLPQEQVSSGSEFSISSISSPEPQEAQNAQTEQEGSVHTENGSPLIPDLPGGQSVPQEEEVDSAEQTEHDKLWGGGRERYQGSDSMYRYHIRRERSLLFSMEQLRSDDLSLHLYNAHAWKTRLRSQEQFAAKGPLRKKSAWIPGGRGQGLKEWYPDRSWTSWPLEPSLVPRPGEDFGVPRESRQKLERDLSNNGWRPGENLQEDVVGLLLRRANEQWSSRSGATVQRPKRAVSPYGIRESQDSRSNSRQRYRTRSVSLPPADAADINVDVDMAAKSEEEEEEHFGVSSVPVMSADEDRLRTILRPTTNHILSRLDDLLMALHHNRNGQYKAGQYSEADDSRPSSLSRSRSRGSKPRHVRKQAQDDDDDDTELNNDDDEDRASPSESRSRSRKRHKTNQSLPSESTRSSSAASSEGSDYGPYHRGPRDWSEVLGLATLIGWDEAAVQRTLQRCADLFGEDMQLSIIENGHPNNQSESLHFNTDDTGEIVSNTAEEAFSTDPLQTPSDGIQYVCPFLECPHHTVPYPSSKGYRFREHLRRTHKFSAEKIKELEARILGSTRAAASTPTITSTKRNPRGWVAPDDLVCPFPGCQSRARARTEPFPAAHRLVEHLIRTHHWDPRKQSPPPALRPPSDKAGTEPHNGRASSEISDPDFDKVVGGVHNDGFLEPLDIRIGRPG